MDIKKYKAVSIEFRRIASNLLRTDADQANLNMIRFKSYIDKEPIVKDIIFQKINDIEYDYNQCYVVEDGYGRSKIVPPIDEAQHLRAQYDYLTNLCEDEKISIKHLAYGYIPGSDTFTRKTQDFLDMAFKPMIDYIIDSISKEIMMMEEDTNKSVTANFHGNSGTINLTQGDRNTATYNTTNTTGNNVEDIIGLINLIRPMISAIDADEDIKEDVLDDLDIICEQVQSDKPKKSRLKKAVENIKNFITMATSGAVLSTGLAENITKLISAVQAILPK